MNISSTKTLNKKKSILLILLFSILAFGGYYFYSSTKKDLFEEHKKHHLDKPQSVVIVQVKSKDINVTVNALGTVTATTTVNIKSMVQGQLMKLFFHEGAFVRAGEKLALIDPRPFEVILEQAQGQLTKDEALLENAKIDLKRYEDLKRQNSVSIQVYDTQKALVHQYEGTIKTDLASVKSAKLQLSYCTITTPISGRVGLRAVDVGNIIHPTDQSGIVSISSNTPITTLFAVPQENAALILNKISKHEQLSLEAYDKSDTQKIQSGLLISADNQIDPSTGTLKLRAEFANKEQTLLPNQFVNIHLLLDTLHNAIVIPKNSVQYGAKGSFVYVVDANNSVHVRDVKAGISQNESILIQSGLEENEKIVVDGLDKLREGVKVIPADASHGSKEGHRHKKEHS